ncbi:MAG TPA: hypothetical protein VFL28_04145 [bacterium]|nr:hypothetical protein [bacterium]
MEVQLKVEPEGLPEGAAESLTRELCRDLNRQAGAGATLVPTPREAGAKGTIEQLFLPGQALFGTVITPGAGAAAGAAAIAALTLDLFRSYFERLPKLRLTFARADGRRVTLTRESLEPPRVAATSGELRDLYGRP